MQHLIPCKILLSCVYEANSIKTIYFLYVVIYIYNYMLYAFEKKF